MILTKTLFLNRFTIAETTAILQASEVSPAVHVFLFKLEQALDVDTKDDVTIAGIHALEAGGLLSAGRADQILCLGFAKVVPPFNIDDNAHEIVEIELNGTATLEFEDGERVAFALGNYEVQP